MNNTIINARMTFGVCRTCDGRIVYHPRRPDDPKPRTCTVDDENRWAHTELADWIGNPHRAQPKAPR
jgi:hypothetical protein